MSLEWVALGITMGANVIALAWGAARVSTTVDRLDKTLDKLADALTVESRINAVQDTRLNNHEKRLDDHDDEIDNLRRRP